MESNGFTGSAFSNYKHESPHFLEKKMPFEEIIVQQQMADIIQKQKNKKNPTINVSKVTPILVDQHKPKKLSKRSKTPIVKTDEPEREFWPKR